MTHTPVRVVSPGSFEAENHYYPRVPNARLHPLVRGFLALSNEAIAKRYSHLHPETQPDAILAALSTAPRVLRWAGADLFHVSDDKGVRRNVVIETNSSPSGQKSMPLLDDAEDMGGYRRLIEEAFLPWMRKRRGLPKGRLAVLCDKNRMETTGYAATLAELTGEDVLWVDFRADAGTEHVRVEAGVLEVLHEGTWTPIRGAFRYVTQKPWTRLPPITRTFLFNPVLACLAGGRNKLIAAKAYDLFNADMASSGLRVRSPETIWDVALREVEVWVERMGGIAVVKNPYSNAGQGVWTITRPEELEAFLAAEHTYDRFIVQGLIGNLNWTSRTRGGRLYHVGTVPNRRGEIHVADLRCMVMGTPEGFRPIALYARRARKPLTDHLDDSSSSWDMLGTNLSVKAGAGFDTEPNRLMLMDERDFNRLGLGLDDLVEAYLQTCLSVLAIDRMAQRLVTKKGRFRRRLFSSLVPDKALLAEVLR